MPSIEEVVIARDVHEKFSLEEYDGIYIGGGNTFKLLKELFLFIAVSMLNYFRMMKREFEI